MRLNFRFGVAFLLLASGVRGNVTPPIQDAPAPPVLLSALELSLHLSSGVGRIIEASGMSAGGKPEYILIQDVHKHPEVQSNVASAIIQAYQQWGAKKVFMEGAVSTVDLSMFHRVPDKTRLMLLQRLVNDGDLSGPELAAVFLTETEWRNPPVSPFQLIGMEDAKLYRENLVAYQQVLSQREAALHEIEKIRRLQASMRIAESNILAQQLERTEALIRLKLTPAEYEAYRANKASIPAAPALTPMLRSAEKFYELAALRSHAFLIQANKKVPASPGPRVLVIGGFHTPFMAAELSRQGKSYIVISPHITAPGNEPLYEKHMLESIQSLQLVAKPR